MSKLDWLGSIAVGATMGVTVACFWIGMLSLVDITKIRRAELDIQLCHEQNARALMINDEIECRDRHDS